MPSEQSMDPGAQAGAWSWWFEPVENLWWRHWRWHARVGVTGYRYGIATTKQAAERKARAAISALHAEGHR